MILFGEEYYKCSVLQGRGMVCMEGRLLSQYTHSTVAWLGVVVYTYMYCRTTSNLTDIFNSLDSSANYILTSNSTGHVKITEYSCSN